MRCLAIAAAALAVSAQPSAQPSPQMSCVYNLPSNIGTATWDLTGLAGESGVKIIDSRDNNDSPYDYYLRVCNDMPPPTAGSCNTTCGSDGNCRSGPGPAFQVCNNAASCGTACYRLGDTASHGQFVPSFFNPSHGIGLVYTNGDNCTVFTNQGAVSRARSVWVDFMCYDTTGLLPQQDQVIEDVQCGYHIMVYSRAGCPEQCPFVGIPNKLCGGHGLCDWDTSQNAARCFCNAGWSGPDCMTAGDKGLPPAKSYAGNVAGAFFGGLFTGLILVVGFVAVKSFTSGSTFGDAFRGIFGGSAAASSGYTAAPTGASAGFDSSYRPAFTGAASTAGGYEAPVADNQGPLIA